MEKWTKEELEQHIVANINDSYSAAIVISGLFKKLYGDFPKIHLSGMQAECAEVVCNKLPCVEENCCRG